MSEFEQLLFERLRGKSDAGILLRDPRLLLLCLGSDERKFTNSGAVFFEKVAVLVLAAVVLPAAVGHLSDPPTLVLAWSGSVLMLLVAMMLLSNAIWHLPKNE